MTVIELRVRRSIESAATCCWHLDNQLKVDKDWAGRGKARLPRRSFCSMAGSLKSMKGAGRTSFVRKRPMSSNETMMGFFIFGSIELTGGQLFFVFTDDFSGLLKSRTSEGPTETDFSRWVFVPNHFHQRKLKWQKQEVMLKLINCCSYHF